jgi:hypothetical protein
MALVGGPAMGETAQTAAAPVAIWAISVVVAMLCLAFWLIAIMVADRRQARDSRRRRMPGVPRMPGATGVQAAPGALMRDPGIPAQRTGDADADRAELSPTWPGSPDRDDGEYW